jgi:hypothetical protein
LAAIADKLRQPLMPWQRLVADVACEIDPLTGLPAYREVRVTVPRQSGKTTLFLAWQINRCVSKRWQHPQRSAFTAQTGKDARDKWLDELFPLIRASQIKRLVATRGKRLHINEGMGNESIQFRTGSLIRLLSTSTTSGHSKTLQQAVMDEVWHDVDDRREQGLRPAMITVPDAQLLVCSTAGTDASVVLNRKVDSGRKAAETGAGSGVAYFEWSAPDGWDPDDEASYFTFMPALCPDPPCRCAGPGETWRHTITSLAAIRAEREAMTPAEFRRAYGNLRTSYGNDGIITAGMWGKLHDPDSQRSGDVALGADVSPLRDYAAISVYGLRGDEFGHGQLVDYRPGTDWLVGRLAEWKDALDPVAIGMGRGTYQSLKEDLTEVGIEVPEPCQAARCADPLHPNEPARGDLAVTTATSMAAACGQMIDAVRQETLRVVPSDDLDDSAVGARTRMSGDTIAWAPKDSRAVIAPIVSLTVARWAYETRAHLVADADYDILASFY